MTAVPTIPTPLDLATTVASFRDFDLDPILLSGIAELGFESPTPIQTEAMPPLLKGRDVIGRARTGSGKTAAFGLPLLQRLKGAGKGVRALVLTPTRELALQVTGALRSYAKGTGVRMVTVYGGSPYYPQVKALRGGVPVVVGTPGRLIDLLDRGDLDLSGVDYVVLDEADEMLRMGFIEDVEKLLGATGRPRQVALFSATMPPAIRRVAQVHLTDPLDVQVESRSLTVEHIEQRWMRVPGRHKLEALGRVLRGTVDGTALVFARTRAGCGEVAEALISRGISADALHGDMSQPARERVLGRMRAKHLDVVVATDVAARGIDVAHITHVINLDLPTDTETYVHRVGRTGRAGRKGVAISFVTPEEVRRIYGMQKRLAVPIEQVQVPSDGAIARRQRAELQEELFEAMGTEPEEGDPATQLLEQLREATGWSAGAVAAAALRVLSQERGVWLDAEPNEEPPAWCRPPAPSRKQGAPRGNGKSGPKGKTTTELFLPIGRNRGVRPADIVGALTRAAGVPGSEVGRVTIAERKTFVGVSESAAKRILKETPTLSIRGNDVQVRRAHKRTER